MARGITIITGEEYFAMLKPEQDRQEKERKRLKFGCPKIWYSTNILYRLIPGISIGKNAYGHPLFSVYFLRGEITIKL